MLEISRMSLLHLRFQPGDAVVRFLQAEALVELDVLLDVQPAVEVLHADVMHVEIVARGDGANLGRTGSPGGWRATRR